jgi:NhaA family Na+:H+ antiporter
MVEPVPSKAESSSLERIFQRAITPFESFLHHESASALLLMACTVLALVLANSPWSHAYHTLLDMPLGIGFGRWEYRLSLHHAINDGLMALFFFVAGLEIKRELLVGSLSSGRRALLPALAALGGMLVPAGAYLLVNHASAFPQGWGVPMATDIAFAVGVLMLMGARIPRSVAAFLVALAIVDDLGAVVVIALFYSGELVLPALTACAALVGVLVLCNLAGLRSALPYFLVGVLLWFSLQAAGIHATLAGVVTAFAIPARPRYAQARFGAQVRELMTRFEGYDGDDRADLSILRNETQFAILGALRQGIGLVEAPLQRMENHLHLPVAFGVVPLFALANAGVPISSEAVLSLFSEPAALGILLGLAVGKPLGIVGFSWLALRLGWGDLPAGMNLRHLLGVGLLGGIGFTMSIFVAELGFVDHPEILDLAKSAILLASMLAGMAGWAWFRFGVR